MKVTFPSILLLSILALSTGQTGAESVAVETEKDAAPLTADTQNEGDAGKECAAEDCPNPDDVDATTTTTTEAEEEDPSCPSRPHVIRCAAKYLDTNQNGVLERAELESVMKTVPWLLRGLLNIIGSIDTIMKKCDADGDGSITIDHDMEATKETCLATCFKRKAFKKLFFPDCTE